jgi:hypothetical protein
MTKAGVPLMPASSAILLSVSISALWAWVSRAWPNLIGSRPIWAA